jgi:hypothetical protein
MQRAYLENDTSVRNDKREWVATLSSTASRASFAAAAASTVSLAALHVLSPEFDPTWRAVSEYALGHYGGVLALMFSAMAVGSAALLLAIQSQVRTLWGRIGLALLVPTAIGLAMAAVFDVRHELHGLAALIGIPSQTIAPILISKSLIRTPEWSRARRALLWPANFTWISLALLFAALFIGLAQSGGEFGPHVLLGIPNRLFIFAYGIWMMSVAWRAGRLRRV